MTDDLAARLAKAAREGSAAHAEAMTSKRERHEASLQRARDFESRDTNLLAELGRTAPDMFRAAGVSARTIRNRRGWLLIIQSGYRGRSGVIERVDLLLTEDGRWFVSSGGAWQSWQIRVRGGRFLGGQFIGVKTPGRQGLSLPFDEDTLRRRFEKTLIATAERGNRDVAW
jgi:hypothetical protein